MLGDAARAKVEAAIEALEKRTDAEVTVAIAPSSGSYRSVDHAGGAILAALVLTALLMGHFHGRSVPEEWIPPLTALAYVVGAAAARGSWARRLLTRAGTRSRQVREAARIAFVDAGTGATRKRDGVLVYISLLERAVLVVPDLGVEGKLEGASWQAISRELALAVSGPDLEAALLRAIEKTGEKLALALPRTGSGARETPRRLVVLA
ncbi:hypothetical protein HY251_13360 [bacterium]|nr:hypothetical protein [bacterium]